MGRPRTPYGTAELEFVKRNLADILTLDHSEVSALARRNHPNEVLSIVATLQAITEILHAKWAGAVLAKLPESAWERDEGGQMHIKAGSASSMRYLSNDLADEESEEAHKLLSARQTLMERLVNEMPPSYRAAYRDMLCWVSADEHEDPNVARFPLSGDTAFGYKLLVLEEVFNERVKLDEQIWRKDSALSDSVSTPFEVTRKCSEDNLQYFKDVLDSWWRNAANVDGVPDSLLARVSANLSVNRALLEYASSDERGLEAADMTVEFLDQLNRKGICEVPIEIDHWNAANEQEKLANLLHHWFGHEGIILEKGGYFNRPMYDSDIDTVVRWSVELRQQYILGRGVFGGDREHGRPHNLFLFALAMVGSFFARAKTDHEFKGHNNRTYAVFPDRGTQREKPPVHAAQVLMQSYGMIAVANREQELSAVRVRTYAQTARVKRWHLQQLLAFAVKKRTAPELLVLFNQLERVRKARIEAYCRTRTGAYTIPFGNGVSGTSIFFTYSLLNKLFASH
ncbi:hypothetical protein FAZ95_03520 [Trinickia violacea]|uniref:Uncharacterized protein n=1 Tax=Trinickia violacea TaxID=2571746 RepID=A0A4P8IN99_9BURK|nr:hypothetical protein [Trinickia violacea]QCP48334.1 hypothetical protein FAZ95_03520 [Trinickia violacea]